GRDGVYNLIQTRPDWRLSRQRAGGVGIRTFRSRGCGTVECAPSRILHLEHVLPQRDADSWYELPARALLPPAFRCGCGSDEIEQYSNILDVWFDSGCSHEAVLRPRADLGWPADLYVEAVDQHRGWFQVSLMTSVAVYDQAPYRAVLTHGLILDEAAK